MHCIALFDDHMKGAPCQANRNEFRALEAHGKIGLLMKKDTQLTVRIRSDLKRQLEVVAEREGRSVAQVCEVFLEASFENYKKEGTKLLQRFLAQRKPTQKGD